MSDEISNWQKRTIERHPLFCQFFIALISGALLLCGAYIWGKEKIPSKTIFKEEKLQNRTRKITLLNKGLLPATGQYYIISDDANTIKTKRPNPHVTVTPAKDKKVKLDVENLPHGMLFDFTITGNNSVTIKNVVTGNTVAIYPPQQSKKETDSK